MKIDQNELLADPLIDGKKFERAIRKLSLFEGRPGEIKIGRASCRERVCSVV
jgi:hypothetical protein